MRVGMVIKADMEVHTNTESHRSRMIQACTSKPSKGFCLPNRHSCSVTDNSSWINLDVPHKHTLSWCFLDCSINLSKVTFPDSVVETKEGKFLINVLVSSNMKLIMWFY